MPLNAEEAVWLKLITGITGTVQDKGFLSREETRAIFSAAEAGVPSGRPDLANLKAHLAQLSE